MVTKSIQKLHIHFTIIVKHEFLYIKHENPYTKPFFIGNYGFISQSSLRSELKPNVINGNITL
jgi:hypothetical protein